jgi:outer membrane murein-binding lipoprotein Lpp
MNALKHSSLPPHPGKPPRRAIRANRQKRWQTHQLTAAEVGVKLTVNTVLAIVAGVTLVRLVPHNLSQQSKLDALKVEVATLETRVNQLEADFTRQFDPQQAKSIMQEQSVRVDPQQRRIVWQRSLSSNQQPEAVQPNP